MSSPKEREKENLSTSIGLPVLAARKVRDIVTYDKNADAMELHKILELGREEYIRIVGFISIDGNPQDSRFSSTTRSFVTRVPPFISSF